MRSSSLHKLKIYFLALELLQLSIDQQILAGNSSSSHSKCSDRPNAVTDTPLTHLLADVKNITATTISVPPKNSNFWKTRLQGAFIHSPGIQKGNASELEIQLKIDHSWKRKDLVKKGTPQLEKNNEYLASQHNQTLLNKAFIYKSLLIEPPNIRTLDQRSFYENENICIYSHTGLKEPTQIAIKKTTPHFEYTTHWMNYSDVTSLENLKNQGFQVTFADFANAKLGGGTFGESFAQEEQMFAQSKDLILLLSIFESEKKRLYTRHLPTGERDHQEVRFAPFSGENTSNPLLITNLRFHQKLKTSDSLQTTDWKNHLQEKIEHIPSVPSVDVIAFAAPELRGYDKGRAYSEPLVVDLFSNAVTAFAMVKNYSQQQGKKTYLNSGLWGAGAFGHNPSLSIAIQYLAAKSVFDDQDIVHFWGVPRAIAQKAEQLVDSVLEKLNQTQLTSLPHNPSIRAKDVLQAILKSIASDPEWFL